MLGIVADQTYEITTIADENIAHVLETQPSIQEEEPWGTDLMNYVMANQHVTVRCPWMGGAEVTLGEAMTTYGYPLNMTEKDVPAVMAVVDELLASRVEEKEETEEEENPQKNERGEETEDDETKRPLAKAKKAIQVAKVESETQKDKPRTVIKVKKPVENRNNTAKVEWIKTGGIKSFEAQAPIAVPAKVERSVPMTAETGIITHPYSASSGDTKAMPDLNKSQPAAKEEAEFFVAPKTEVRIDTEFAEFETANPRIAKFLEGPIEDSGDAQLPQESSEISDFSHKLTDDGLAEFDDLEIMISHHEEETLQVDEQLDEPEVEFSNLSHEREEIIDLAEDEVRLSERTETITAERLIGIDLSIDEIETSLLQVAEKIGSSPPETIETVNDILDRIVELPETLKSDSGDEISETEIQENLEELFTELFKRLGIGYTPEVIEALARLTMRYYLGEKNQAHKKEQDEDTIPHDRGTHEVIKRLLAGLSKIKKIMTNAYTIGKSALRLYRYDFPSELKKRLAASQVSI